MVVAVIGLTAAVTTLIAMVLWMRATRRRAREAAATSPTGTAGPPPFEHVPGDRQRGMWHPQDRELEGWTWSGGRAQPPDVLSGRHALYDTIIVRELRGTFRGREAFSQIRRPQRTPALATTAPQTQWSVVAGLRGRVQLPPFFALIGEREFFASLIVVDVDERLQKFGGALGRGTVLWSEPRWAAAVVSALRPVLQNPLPQQYLLASEGSTLFVCASHDESEQAVLRRLAFGERALRSFEQLSAHDTAR